MGTAHGRVKIDADTRGLSSADRALDAFSRTIRAISGRLGGFETTMNRMEAELRDAEREFNQADRAAGRFDRTVGGLRGTTHGLNIDVLELSNRMRGLYNTTERVVPSLLLASRAIREFRGSSGGMLGVFQTIGRSGGIGTVLSLITSRFIGMGKALESVTGSQRKVLQFAGGFRTFAFVSGFLASVATSAFSADRAFRAMGKYLPFLDGVMGRFLKHIDGVEGMDFALAGFRHTVEATVGRVRSLTNNMDRFALGSVQLIGGMALVRTNVNQLIGRFGNLGGLLRGMPGWMKAALGGAIVFAKAFEQILGKALVTTSNLILDLVNAGTQLGKGFLALPGAVAMGVTAFGTLKAIIAPMKKAFKDILKGDPKDIAKGLALLPEALKPFGQALVDVLPKWKELQNSLQATFIGGADKQLRAISGEYLPAISRGSLMVANSWRTAKDQVVAFVDQTQTVSDVQRIFMNTSQTMNNFKDSIRPAAEGLRDLAAVGSDFLKALSAGLPSIAQQFADWARINRENGNLFRWMTDAWRGVKDLVNGLKDAGRAMFTLLTLFADRSGAGALDRFANAMERFNNAVQKSAASGVLKQIGDTVRNLGTDKIRELWDIIKLLAGALKDVLPLVVQISNGFRDVMIPAIQAAVFVVKQIADVIQSLGGAQVIGWILGLVGAFKLFAAVLGPIKNLALIAFGAFTGFKGATNLVIGLQGVLENFGGIGRRASNAIGGIGDSLAGFVSKLGLAAIAVGALWMAWTEGEHQINAMKASMDDAAKHTLEFRQNLSKAFLADRGFTGKNVFDTVKTQTDTMLTDLKATGEKVPSILANIRGMFDKNGLMGGAVGNEGWGQQKAFNDLQKGAQDAQKATVAFDKLGLSSENLTAIITGSQSSFHEFVATVRASGDGGNEAAAKLNQMHDTFTRMQIDFQNAGPGAALLAEGIQKIADAGGDADSKLTGMKLALEGLGLDKTSQYENAIALAEAVNKIATEASTAADQSQSLTDLWGPNGELNAGFSANANNLFNQLSPAIEAFKRSVAGGADVGTAFKLITDQIPALAAAFTPVGGSVEDTTAKIQTLISQLGGLPDTVKILMSLEGKDQVTRDLAQAYIQLQTAGFNVPVNIVMKDPATAEQEIDKVIGPILDDWTTHTDNLLQIKPGLDQGALDRIGALLASKGIPMPGGPPVAPLPLPVAPTAAPAAPGAPAPPIETKVNIDQTEIDKYKQTITDLQAQVQALNDKPAKIQIDTASLSEVQQRIKDVQNVLHDGKLEFDIVAHGYDETVYVIDQVTKAVTNLINEVSKIPIAFQNAFNGAGAIITAFGGTMVNAGLKLMQDFASGITAGIPATVKSIEDALAEIKLRLPSSPPKKGPLSGTGYVDRSGMQLATDFAGGIISGYPIAGKAADGLASAVGAKLPYSSGSFVKDTGFLKQFSDILQFAQNFIGVMKQVSDTVFGTLKLASDPLGKGGFFGQSTAGAFGFQRDPNVTDADLRKKREDAAQADARAQTDHAGTGSVPGPVGQGREAIATAIAAEAFKRGYTRDTAVAAVAAAMKESSLDPNVVNATGHESLFQTSADKKVGKDPAAQIKWFFDTMDKLGGPSAVGTNPLDFIASNIEKGGYSGSALAAFSSQAAPLVDALKTQTTATQTNTTATTTATTTAVTPTLRPDLTVTGRQGLKPAAENLLEVISAMFPGVTNIGGKRADPLPDHPAGRALDIMIGKNLALGDQINQFLRDNAQALGIHSTIWRDTWKDMAGNASTVSGHMDHIHARVTESATGFNNALLGTAPPGLTAKGAQGTQNDILAELRAQTPLLDQAITSGQDPNSTDQQVAQSLATIQAQIDQQNQNDTPAGRQQMQALESVKSSIMTDKGMTQGQNPIDQASSFASGAMNVAGDIVGVLQAGVEAWTAAKNLTDIGIRYPANTEDIMGMIDDFQKFIDLAAKIAKTVGDITGMGAGADPSGITSAISAVAGLISSALEAINAGIDLAQEAYHIWGSYFGEFLGILAGGAAGALQGNVRFLLDQNTGQLLAYSQDNPQDKRGHNVPGMIHQPDYQQAQNNINVYGGPGSDPRDNTRQMMFQVKAAAMTGATSG